MHCEPAGAAALDLDSRLRGWLRDYADYVTRVLRTAGTPAQDLEDAVQRTFIVAARRHADVRRGSERAFLLQTALHVAAHARRSAARRREWPTSELPEAVDPTTPELLASARREQRLLQRLLERLLPELRSVLVLHEVEELTMAEIAVALGIPPGTVASRLRRAKSELRQRWAAAVAVLGAALSFTSARARAAVLAAARSVLVHAGASQVALSLAGLGVVTWMAAPARQDAPSSPAPHAAVVSARAATPARTPALPAEPPPADSAAIVSVDEPAPSRKLPGGKTTTPSGLRAPSANEALRAELQQLDRARAALAGGRASEALATLDAYARSTPRGALRLEAEVLRIDALARSGRSEQARARAAAFLARHPQSVLAARVRQLAAR
jgi:RNA polymerase sigma-70 factor (ECF subfamily)